MLPTLLGGNFSSMRMIGWWGVKWRRRGTLTNWRKRFERYEMPVIWSRTYKKANQLSLQTGFHCGRHGRFPHRIYSSQSHQCPLHEDMCCLLRAPCKLLRCCDVINVDLYVYLIKSEAGQVDKNVTGMDNTCLKKCTEPCAAKILFGR